MNEHIIHDFLVRRDIKRLVGLGRKSYKSLLMQKDF
jgi:hypothetical protein